MFVVLFLFLVLGVIIQAELDLSPYNQYFPDCNADKYENIQKKTSAKALLCPMIKDEIGFLSEWIAYYQIHGFDHFFIFDDGSSDQSLDELKPWIDSKMVTVVANWTDESLHYVPRKQESAFNKKMATKFLLESNCKHKALEWGYDIYISLDIDEYLIPMAPGQTIVDEMVTWFNQTGRIMNCIHKNNFPSTPHLMEPVNLLTIEAYQTRMPAASRMNYYTSVMPKCAFQLGGPEHSNYTSEFIAECCNFHGCALTNVRHNRSYCSDHKEEIYRISGKGKKYPVRFVINHYSRSLEKFALKSKTWTTASGEVKHGESSDKVASNYDIPKFLSRSVGWHHDPIALRYSCQVRSLLKNITNEDIYLRPGNIWYRNPEFGKPIEDADKRGRYGRPNPPNFKTNLVNPYNYHGEKFEFGP